MGSTHRRVVKAAREAIPMHRRASAMLGVIPNQAGTVAMVGHATELLKATLVRSGFILTEYREMVDVLVAYRQALQGYEPELNDFHFADNSLYDGLHLRCMVRLVKDGKCDGLLVDTMTKVGRNLFDFLSDEELHATVFVGKREGISAPSPAILE